MQAGEAYFERHNQGTGTVYRNIGDEYCLEVPGSKWATLPNVIENDQAKSLWDFQIQTDNMMMANQPDILVVDKRDKKAGVVDVTIPRDSDIRKRNMKSLRNTEG